MVELIQTSKSFSLCQWVGLCWWGISPFSEQKLNLTFQVMTRNWFKSISAKWKLVLTLTYKTSYVTAVSNTIKQKRTKCLICMSYSYIVLRNLHFSLHSKSVKSLFVSPFFVNNQFESSEQRYKSIPLPLQKKKSWLAYVKVKMNILSMCSH
jgi:hypothetical protein